MAQSRMLAATTEAIDSNEKRFVFFGKIALFLRPDSLTNAFLCDGRFPPQIV